MIYTIAKQEAQEPLTGPPGLSEVYRWRLGNTTLAHTVYDFSNFTEHEVTVLSGLAKIPSVVQKKNIWFLKLTKHKRACIYNWQEQAVEFRAE